MVTIPVVEFHGRSMHGRHYSSIPLLHAALRPGGPFYRVAHADVLRPTDRLQRRDQVATIPLFQFHGGLADADHGARVAAPHPSLLARDALYGIAGTERGCGR